VFLTQLITMSYHLKNWQFQGQLAVAIFWKQMLLMQFVTFLHQPACSRSAYLSWPRDAGDLSCSSPTQLGQLLGACPVSEHTPLCWEAYVKTDPRSASLLTVSTLSQEPAGSGVSRRQPRGWGARGAEGAAGGCGRSCALRRVEGWSSHQQLNAERKVSCVLRRYHSVQGERTFVAFFAKQQERP